MPLSAHPLLFAPTCYMSLKFELEHLAGVNGSAADPGWQTVHSAAVSPSQAHFDARVVRHRRRPVWAWESGSRVCGTRVAARVLA